MNIEYIGPNRGNIWPQGLYISKAGGIVLLLKDIGPNTFSGVRLKTIGGNDAAYPPYYAENWQKEYFTKYDGIIQIKG